MSKDRVLAVVDRARVRAVARELLDAQDYEMLFWLAVDVKRALPKLHIEAIERELHEMSMAEEIAFEDGRYRLPLVGASHERRMSS